MANIVICNTKIGPYHAARASALAARVPGVLAVEVSGNEGLYPWWDVVPESGPSHITLCPGESFESVPVDRQIAALHELLTRESPEVVIVDGYSEPVMRAAAAWARRHRRLSVLLFMTWAGSQRRWPLKEWAKRLLLHYLFDAVGAGGERHFAYARWLGIPEGRLWKLFNVVDNDHFANGTRETLRRAPLARKRLGLPERYFLYVGAFERWKNLGVLLEAYRRYRMKGGDWSLVLVGTGRELPSLLAQVRVGNIPDVLFPGMKSYAELPAYYALASCFILPSRSETWGLVINEAEACGLPILASTQCGCLPELVHRGINGFTFAPDDVDGLARLMRHLSGGVVDLPAFWAASQRIVHCYTPDTWARALLDCIEHGQEARRGTVWRARCKY